MAIRCAAPADGGRLRSLPHPLQQLPVVPVQQMGIHLAGGGGRAVAQCLANVVHGDALGVGDTGKAVPLRYNNDKPEKPRNFKGLEVYQADFSSFSNPKNQATKPLFRRGC